MIQEDLSDKRKAAISAMSLGDPIFFKGCLCALAFFLSSVDKNFDANGVSVMEGATAFTRIFGASSAARERVKPSIAPLDTATWAWKLKPDWTATVEKIQWRHFLLL